MTKPEEIEMIGKFMDENMLFIKTARHTDGYPYVMSEGHIGYHPLEYDTSWDCLMPVVEKIESLHDNFHGYFGIHIISNGCIIQGAKLRTDPENFHPAYFADYHGKSKIEATFKAVSEFIKWYNEHETK